MTMGLRLSPEDEKLGCDFVEHGIDNRLSVTELHDVLGNTIHNDNLADNHSNDGNGFDTNTHVVTIHRRRSSFGIVRTEIQRCKHSNRMAPPLTNNVVNTSATEIQRAPSTTNLNSSPECLEDPYSSIYPSHYSSRTGSEECSIKTKQSPSNPATPRKLNSPQHSLKRTSSLNSEYI